MSTNGQAETGHAMWLLRDALAPFVDRQVRKAPSSRLNEFVRSNSLLKLKGKRIDQWDVAALLKLMQFMWHDVFRHVLGRSERAFVTELQDWRNKWAHQDRLPAEDVNRALDSATRLLRAIAAESQATEIARLKNRLAEPSHPPDPTPHRRAVQPQPSARHGGQADAIREYALANYVAPWRESDADTLTIRAGDIEREMGLRNATPNVYGALEGPKFLSLASLELAHRDGPRRSTTTTYHYRSVS